MAGLSAWHARISFRRRVLPHPSRPGLPAKRYTNLVAGLTHSVITRRVRAASCGTNAWKGDSDNLTRDAMGRMGQNVLPERDR
jgi:hypothetical protein